MKVQVTVAIASYNNSQFINRCVDSVLRQTYKELEVLIVDDGSTDVTFKKCQIYLSDSRVRFISKENGGLSTVRQRGLEEASGDYICFIDADDYLSPTYVESHLQNLTSSNADISVCSTRFESADGTYLPFESIEFACDDSKEPLKLYAYFLNTDAFPYNVTLSDSWNKMYKMSFLQKTGIAFSLPKGFNGTDTVFNWKLALFEPTYSTIKKEEYVHVIYKSSAVHRKKKNLYKGFQIITRQLIETSKKQSLLNLYKPAISSFYYRFIRMALTDIARESESLLECKNSICNLLKEHRSFIISNNIMCYIPANAELELKIIVLFLMKVPCLLSYYLFCRTRLAKVIRRS